MTKTITVRRLDIMTVDRESGMRTSPPDITWELFDQTGKLLEGEARKAAAIVVWGYVPWDDQN
jgi:hypothetical protein